MKLFKFIKEAVDATKKNSDVIGTVISIGCLGMAVYKAYKNSPVIKDKIEKKKESKRKKIVADKPDISKEDLDEEAKLTAGDYVATVGKEVAEIALWTAGSAVGSIATCAADRRKIAGMAAAIETLEKTSDEFRKANIALNGKEAQEKLENRVMADKISKVDVNGPGVHVTGDGDTYFIDPLLNIVFKSSAQAVKDHTTEFFRKVVSGKLDGSYEEYLTELGIKNVPSAADDYYFPIKYDTELLEVRFVPAWANDMETAVTGMSFYPGLKRRK